jgi:purine-binding chemotaxis protein CheW
MSDGVGGSTHLVFRLAGEHYATPVGEVEEVLEWQEVTVVPRCPDYLLGIINVRGNLIPVLELRRRFGIAEDAGASSADAERHILVVRMAHGEHRVQMGFVVDAVDGVVDIPRDDLEPPPAIGNRFEDSAVEAVARHRERLLLVVNPDAVLSKEQLDADYQRLDAGSAGR